MVILVQGFEPFVLVMVKVKKVWVVIHEGGVLYITVNIQASLCGQFVVILH